MRTMRGIYDFIKNGESIHLRRLRYCPICEAPSLTESFDNCPNCGAKEVKEANTEEKLGMLKFTQKDFIDAMTEHYRIIAEAMRVPKDKL